MQLSKLNKLLNKGRVQAIVKDIAGRRMLIGFERNSKRSRKSHVKFFSKPIDLALLKGNSNEEVTTSDTAPEEPAQ